MQREKHRRHLRKEEESRRTNDREARGSGCLACAAKWRGVSLGVAERQETRPELTELSAKVEDQGQAHRKRCCLYVLVLAARESLS